MSLTRSLLKELQISPDAAERIIAAHAESIDALRQERDAARGEAAQLESIRAALAEMTQARDEACQARDSAREELSALGGQFDSYRQQVETEKHQQARHANPRAACEHGGFFGGKRHHALDGRAVFVYHFDIHVGSFGAQRCASGTLGISMKCILTSRRALPERAARTATIRLTCIKASSVFDE